MVSGASPITHHASPRIESVARQLLRRYGVVFRDLLARESLVQSWRDLLVQYRRMELQGEIRGGRFVSGFVGEQFALPEAVQSMRALRQTGFGLAQEVKLSACDPLNLAGVILPGPRIPAVPTNMLVFKDGTIVRTVIGRGGEDRSIGLAQVLREADVRRARVISRLAQGRRHRARSIAWPDSHFPRPIPKKFPYGRRQLLTLPISGLSRHP